MANSNKPSTATASHLSPMVKDFYILLFWAAVLFCFYCWSAAQPVAALVR